jgi:hypothetical protein
MIVPAARRAAGAALLAVAAACGRGDAQGTARNGTSRLDDKAARRRARDRSPAAAVRRS